MPKSKDDKPGKGGLYRGKPELEDGYTKTSNEYLEALYKDPVVDLRTRIRLYIERWTWGFGKKEAELSQVKMASELKVQRRHLQRALNELIVSKRITCSKYGAGLQTCSKYGAGCRASYGINKYYKNWTENYKPAPNMEHPPAPNMEQVGGALPLYGKESVRKDSVCTPPTPEKGKSELKFKPKSKPKVFVPPELEEVQAYFTSNGFTLEAANRFHSYYSNGRPPWHDGQGKPVRSWKQKAIAVWFKDENKPGSNGNDRQKSAWERSRDSALNQANVLMAIRERRQFLQNGNDTTGDPGRVYEVEHVPVDPD